MARGTRKTPQYPKNPNGNGTGALKGGTLSDFLTSIVAKHQKIEGDPLGKFSSKKVSQCRKKLKGDPLVSPGTVTRKNRKNLFGSVS